MKLALVMIIIIHTYTDDPFCDSLLLNRISSSELLHIIIAIDAYAAYHTMNMNV